MPVVQKVKSLLHLNHAPTAPAAPAMVPVEPIVAPLNGQTLLTQREALAHPDLDMNHDGRIDAVELNRANALDRNLDGRVDAADMLVGQQTAYVQTAQRASLVRAEPTIIETIQKDVVVHERIHPMEKEEIQPIIYREREQLDVKQVTQMLHETMIQPTLIQQRELPAERREVIVERGAPIAENIIAPTTTRDATLRTQVIHAPIVNEVVKKTIIEEIQPVLERDIIQSTIIQNTQPIYEKVVEAPTVYREVRIHNERRLSGAGSLEMLAAQGFNLGEHQQTMAGVPNAAPLYTEMAGNRRSLNEALPVSYGYLNQSVEVKMAETEAHNRSLNNGAPLASKMM